MNSYGYLKMVVISRIVSSSHRARHGRQSSCAHWMSCPLVGVVIARDNIKRMAVEYIAIINTQSFQYLNVFWYKSGFTCKTAQRSQECVVIAQRWMA